MILPAYFSKTQQAADIYAELMPKQREIYLKNLETEHKQLAATKSLTPEPLNKKNENALNKKIIEESKLPFNAKRSFEVNNLTVNDGSYTGSIMNGKPEGMGKLVTKEFEFLGNFKEGKFVAGSRLPRTEESSDSVDTDASANIVNEEISDLESEFQNEEPITLQNEKEAQPQSDVSKVSGEVKKAPVDVRNKYIEKLGGYYTGPTINGQSNGRGSVIFDSNPSVQFIGEFKDGDPVEGFVKYKQNPETKQWEGDFNIKISWEEVLNDKTEI